MAAFRNLTLNTVRLALECARQAVDIHHALKNRKYHASAIVNLSDILNKLKRAGEAIDLLQTAQGLTKDLKNPALQADIEATLGDSFAISNQYS